MGFHPLKFLKPFWSTNASKTSIFSFKDTACNPNTAYLIDHEAVVEKTIKPYESGQVRFRGSYWPARCEQEITLRPTKRVYVVGMVGITLLVKPAEEVRNHLMK